MVYPSANMHSDRCCPHKFGWLENMKEAGKYKCGKISVYEATIDFK